VEMLKTDSTGHLFSGNKSGRFEVKVVIYQLIFDKDVHRKVRLRRKDNTSHRI